MRWPTTLILLALVALLGGYLVLTGSSSDAGERLVLTSRNGARLDPARIQSIRIETPAAMYILEQTGRTWHLSYPVQADADAGAVSRLIDTLRELRWNRTLRLPDPSPGRSPPDEYGFAAPRATLVVNDGEQTVELIVGRDAPGSQEIFVRRDDDEALFITGRELLDVMPASVLDLRDRRLVNIPIHRIKRIAWITREGPFHVARSGDEAWHIEQPFVARANAPAIRQWLKHMTEFRIREFVAETVAAAALYGLDQPYRQVTFTGESASDSSTLRIGNPADKDATLYYANILGRDQVFTVSADVVNGLEPSRRQMRDYRLTTLSAAEISVMQLTDGDTMLQLARDARQIWEVSAPVRNPADTARVDQMLTAWTDATVLEFIDPPIRDYAPYGLQETSRVIRLSRAATSMDRDVVLMLGATTEDGRVYAMPPSGAPVMELSATLLDHFTVNPLAFRDPVVLTVDRASVQRITQRTPGATNTVETTNGLFRAVNAGHVPDTDAIAGALFRLNRLEAAAFIEENPRDLIPYGLDTPHAQLTVGLSTGGLSRVLLIGSAAGPEDHRYAMRQGSDVVFTLAGEVVRSLLKPVSNPIAPVLTPPSSPSFE